MTHECDNCDWKGEKPGKDVWDIHHFWERVEPGAIVPSGECPECGCLCYIVTDSDRLAKAAPDLLAACRAFLDMPYPCVGQMMSHQTAQDIQKYRQVTRAAVAMALGIGGLEPIED